MTLGLMDPSSFLTGADATRSNEAIMHAMRA